MNKNIQIENSSLLVSYRVLSGHSLDPGSMTLFLSFKNGSQYFYDKIEPEVIKDFEKSTSKGKFFHEQIRGKYRTKKIA